MNIGLQIFWTGFVLAVFALIAVTLLRKADPPILVKAFLVWAFILGAVAIPVGLIVGIWS